MRLASVLMSLALVACTSTAIGDRTATGSPARAATGGTAWPLRGTAAPSADAIARRPIVVRVPNDSSARPQAGLSQADVVFEIVVEGGLTRYALVFHSQEADRIGPVRSARLSDLQLAPMLKAILAHVGAQQQTLDRIRQAARAGQFVDVDQFEHASAYDRIAERQAPQNVYTSTKRLREEAKDTARVQVPALQFGDSKATGRAFERVVLQYAQSIDRAIYAPDGSAFKRTQGGTPTIDDANKQEVKPANVVVLKTEVAEVLGYVEDELGSLSLEIKLSGEGPAIVLTDGKRFDGTWSRAGEANFAFKDASGAEIRLKPGLTWVHVVPLAFAVGE